MLPVRREHRNRYDRIRKFQIDMTSESISSRACLVMEQTKSLTCTSFGSRTPRTKHHRSKYNRSEEQNTTDKRRRDGVSRVAPSRTQLNTTLEPNRNLFCLELMTKSIVCTLQAFNVVLSALSE